MAQRCSKFTCEDKREHSYICRECDTLTVMVACNIKNPCHHCLKEFSCNEKKGIDISE